MLFTQGTKERVGTYGNQEALVILLPVLNILSLIFSLTVFKISIRFNAAFLLSTLDTHKGYLRSGI